MNSSIVNLNRRILVIDDNGAIHGDFRKILGAPEAVDAALQAAEAKIFGTRQTVFFEIDAASQGEEGLKMVERSLAEGRPYAMAFVDVRMPPGWDGIETTKRIWEICPDLQIVICTAFADCSWSEMQEQINPLDRLLILKKPFDTIEVLQLANALTEKWRLLQESKTKLGDLDQVVKQRTRELEESQIVALNMMEDAVRNREKVEQANEDLKREVAERRKLEEQFREQASLLDKARDAILVYDLEHRISYWNKSAERLYGWTAQEAIGRSVAGLLYKDTTAFQQACKHVIQTGEWVGELQQMGKEGRDLIIEARWTLVRDNAGQPKAILAINTDITDRKKLEAQFLRTQRMETIGTLTSGIAHDLNNILAPILMSAPMLRWDLKPEEVEKMLVTIETSTQRGANLVKQLLTFGRGVEGQRVSVQPKHLINELVKMARETFPKNIILRSKHPHDLWTIRGDATQLHQVLLNLCVNARDAMPQGGTLSVTAENARLAEGDARLPDFEAKPGPYVVLRVEDGGQGIPPEIMDRIFDPFFTTKEPGKGTGLGLSTLMGIVKSHGGFVRVDSHIGKGSRFEVCLPATPDDQTSFAGREQAALPEGQGETILVVDDEALILAMWKQVLESYGYKVLTAGDGVEALSLFAQYREDIDLVLTDLMMPFLDGAGLVRGLRKMNENVKVIASTGIGSQSDQAALIEQMQRLGVHRLLRKPYEKDELLKELDKALHPAD